MKIKTLTQCLRQGLAQRYLKQNWKEVRELDIIHSRQVVSDVAGLHLQLSNNMHKHSNVQRHWLHIHQQIYDRQWRILGGVGQLYDPFLMFMS